MEQNSLTANYYYHRMYILHLYANIYFSKKITAHYRGLFNCILGYVVIAEAYAQVKYQAQIYVITNATE